MITRWSYLITLTTKEPFRIGGKSDPLSEAENPVAVIGSRVCIPGPSLKGALRGEIERFLNDSHYDRSNKRWSPGKSDLQPCIPATKLSRDEDRLVQEGHFRGKGCHYPCKTGDRGNCGPDPHPICPACTLLGAQGLVGFVQVPFLFTEVHHEELYSARMERTSHTVMQGTNRPFQLTPPDTVFRGELEVLIDDSLLGWKLGAPRDLKEPTKGDAWLRDSQWSQEQVLKDLLVDRLQAITTLGGYRSKGFGRVQISVSMQP
jgi:CRISPR/Cas system CSM-associated protein Csm3 (group 7 of RAMP superfamily)